jgi:hypothetical protein
MDVLHTQERDALEHCFRRTLSRLDNAAIQLHATVCMQRLSAFFADESRRPAACILGLLAQCGA